MLIKKLFIKIKMYIAIDISPIKEVRKIQQL